MSPRVETLRNIAVLFAVAFITVCMVQSGGDAEAVYAAVGRMPIKYDGGSGASRYTLNKKVRRLGRLPS